MSLSKRTLGMTLLGSSLPDPVNACCNPFSDPFLVSTASPTAALVLEPGAEAPTDPSDEVLWRGQVTLRCPSGRGTRTFTIDGLPDSAPATLGGGPLVVLNSLAPDGKWAVCTRCRNARGWGPWSPKVDVTTRPSGDRHSLHPGLATLAAALSGPGDAPPARAPILVPTWVERDAGGKVVGGGSPAKPGRGEGPPPAEAPPVAEAPPAPPSPEPPRRGRLRPKRVAGGGASGARRAAARWRTGGRAVMSALHQAPRRRRGTRSGAGAGPGRGRWSRGRAGAAPRRAPPWWGKTCVCVGPHGARTPHRGGWPSRNSGRERRVHTHVRRTHGAAPGGAPQEHGTCVCSG